MGSQKVRLERWQTARWLENDFDAGRGRGRFKLKPVLIAKFHDGFEEVGSIDLQSLNASGDRLGICCGLGGGAHIPFGKFTIQDVPEWLKQDVPEWLKEDKRPPRGKKCNPYVRNVL